MSEGEQEKQDKSDPKTLGELQRRLRNAESVVVDQQGRLHTPDDPEILSTPPQAKTVLRPQRWY